MSQIPAVTLTTTPVDVADGLEAGAYIGQPRPRSTRVLYCTSTTPPDDLANWFLASDGQYITFRAGCDLPPTWMRTVDPLVGATVARAKL